MQRPRCVAGGEEEHRHGWPRTMEEWVPMSFVENSSLITTLGTFRDKVKVEHTWAQGKQGLSPE